MNALSRELRTDFVAAFDDCTADAVAYLCSERASSITGHDLVVDGGILVRSNVIRLSVVY